MGSGNSRLRRKKGNFTPSIEPTTGAVSSKTSERNSEVKFDEVSKNKVIKPLTYAEAASLRPSTNDNMWAIVQRTCASEDSWALNSVKNRRGWKTIRLFVSSTFRDFHAEREVLVKEVGNNSQNTRTKYCKLCL